MRTKFLSLIVITALVYIISVNRAFSQDIPDRPVPPRLVNDFAGMLSGQEIAILEQKLVAFSDSTSTQIAIVIVPSLNGYDKSDYAQRLAEKWGIGIKGLNNGVLILVKPKTADSNGQVFIAQGYGLEGIIPDLTCSEIVDQEILPSFRAGDYFNGLSNAASTIMSLANGEFSAAEYGQKAKKSSSKDIPVGLIIFIVIVIAIVFGKSGGSNRRNISTGGLPFWMLMSMMGSSGRSSHSGSWGGFSGGGGGGFGGFGGGSFGGGGAGGSW